MTGGQNQSILGLWKISEHAQKPLCTVAFSNMQLVFDQWFLTCQKSLMASRSCASAQSKPAISEHAQELHAVDFSPQFLTDKERYKQNK